jgi:hypothetical protein
MDCLPNGWEIKWIRTLQVPVQARQSKISDRFPHLAIDLVGRAADEIDVKTAKAMFLSKFFSNPAIAPHIRPPERALLSATSRLSQAN